MKIKLFIFSIFSLLASLLCAQTPNSNVVSVGLFPNFEDRLTKLEDVELKVVYQFNQRIIDNGKSKQITDTTSLYVGANRSLYYDTKVDALLQLSKIYQKKYSDIEDGLTVSYIEFMDKVGDEEGSFSFKDDYAYQYKDRASQQLTTLDMITDDGARFYSVDEKVPAQEWTLLQDTLTVMGYLCNKAICNFRGRDYIAWYASDIPLMTDYISFMVFPV